MPSSDFNNSARAGPMPFTYSTGVSSTELIGLVFMRKFRVRLYKLNVFFVFVIFGLN